MRKYGTCIIYSIDSYYSTISSAPRVCTLMLFHYNLVIESLMVANKTKMHMAITEEVFKVTEGHEYVLANGI